MNNTEPSNTQKLTIVIPSFNEAENLISLLPEIMEFSKSNNIKVILTDDGSTDSTPAVAGKYTDNQLFRYIRHKKNRGYGAALKTGISETDTEYVITFDADCQHNPADVKKLLEVIISNDADLVIGSRHEKYKFGILKRFGKFIIRLLSKILIQNRIQDLNAGMKMMKTELAKKYIKICPDTFAFSDVITLVFVSEKNVVLEENISVNIRKDGKSKVNFNTAMETVMEIINIAIMFNPMKIFLPVSFIFTLFGIIWSLYIVMQGKGISVGGSLLIVLGILSFLIGLMAEQLSNIKKRMM
ncbi:MAG: glycosyltransferase family 2 protein [Ignavibacteria bacterium]|nr:glycosyltransferase family 2 protein [Ignavibacteria bacterium]